MKGRNVTATEAMALGLLVLERGLEPLARGYYDEFISKFSVHCAGGGVDFDPELVWDLARRFKRVREGAADPELMARLEKVG